jgi:hypothetical protein
MDEKLIISGRISRTLGELIRRSVFNKTKLAEIYFHANARRS